MSDGCHEENRMTCSGCPKYLECDRISQAAKEAMLKMKEHYPKKYRKMMPKRKGRKKSAARMKVKR